MQGEPLRRHPQDAPIYHIIQFWNELLSPNVVLWYTLFVNTNLGEAVSCWVMTLKEKRHNNHHYEVLLLQVYCGFREINTSALIELALHVIWNKVPDTH